MGVSSRRLMKTKLYIAVPLLVVAACAKGTTDGSKSKVDLSTDVSTSIDKFETTAGGTWTELQVLESAHPYANFASERVVVNAAPGTGEMRIVLERFELESGYDFLTLATDAAQERLTGTRTGQEVILAGDSVTITFDSDYSVTKWGYRVRVFQRDACICTEQYQPVCGADGVTYDNRCFATCAGVAVAHQGQCAGDAWVRVPMRLQSDHDYTNNFDYTWTIQEAGASNIRAHFDTIDVERGYDFVRVLDGNDRVVATYTGASTDVTTPDVPGDTIRIQLVTDYSVVRWGFSIDYVEATAACVVDADCGPGRVCTQVQCIRAPCFPICETAGGGGTTYTDVTLDQLNTDPNTYNGQMIRVVGEPGGVARCTRRGCTQDNPCCNTCSMVHTIGNAIELRDNQGQPYGCNGDECSWRNSCRSFQAEENGPYLFEGTFNVDRFGARYLSIDTYRANDCQRRGCSGQVCSNNANVVTTCEARPEYMCYGLTSCEPQRGGHCGFTQTPELQACIANARSQSLIATDVPLQIPDNTPSGVTSVIAAASTGVAAEVVLSLAINHTYRGDLTVTLVSPAGTEHVVHDRAGGSADDVVVQDMSVSTFNGEPVAGHWTLRVVDNARLDTGTIESWSLVIR